MARKDSVNRWQYKEMYAFLSTDFGRDLAMKKFGLTIEELESLVGRNKKGKRVGQLKGKLLWFKITKGGWVKTGPYDFESMRAQGFVAGPNVSFGYMIVDDWAASTTKWCKKAMPYVVYEDDNRHIEVTQTLIRFYEQRVFENGIRQP